MKKMILFSLFVVFLAVSAHAAATVPDVGRYQLCQGYYTRTGLGLNTYDEKAIFKIDTATGHTWRYDAGLGEGAKPAERWYPID